jgi:cobalamin biosynthesis Mg chelatase CobN
LKRSCAHLIGLAVLVAAFGTLSTPSWAARSAAAADTVPCWKRLLNDWYDGTINKVYPIPCYQQAIKHLPPETEIYGSAKEDIQRAEQAAIIHKNAPPEQGGSASTTTGSSGVETPPQTTTTTSTTVTNGTTSTSTAVVVVPPQTTSSPKKKKHGISGALADITPGDPQAFPLPLLILGALAILLVLAGAAGMVWQRTHPREEPPPAV